MASGSGLDVIWYQGVMLMSYGIGLKFSLKCQCHMVSM